jgi:hypothetical protein
MLDSLRYTKKHPDSGHPGAGAFAGMLTQAATFRVKPDSKRCTFF